MGKNIAYWLMSFSMCSIPTTEFVDIGGQKEPSGVGMPLVLPDI